MSVAENLSLITRDIPENTTLVCVSKKPLSDILEAYSAGQRDFGENYVQELEEKFESAPQDIRWHFIGKLQSNKVKKIVGRVYLIHSVDRLSLAEEISKRALQQGVKQKILLQVNVSGEQTKGGVEPEELESLLAKVSGLGGIETIGLMGFGSFVPDDAPYDERVREFRLLKSLKDTVCPALPELSMGVSNDYQLAIECGATMVRVGSKIFGERN